MIALLAAGAAPLGAALLGYTLSYRTRLHNARHARRAF